MSFRAAVLPSLLGGTLICAVPFPVFAQAGSADTAGDTATILIRAMGPSLVNARVQGPLADPALELHDTSGTTIASNDNWKSASDGSNQQADVEATTIPPANDLESALVRTLSPGNHTAVVRGKNNTTGVALVEVYNLQ